MKKVVVLIPAYNLEEYIGNCLNSLLIQTTNNFDIIVVDDGSEDHTKESILNYQDKFAKYNIELKYIYKENGGAASAINVGLKQKLDYKYILIMDGDDLLTPDTIKSRIEFLDKNKDYGAVTGWAEYVYENSKDAPEKTIIEKNNGISDNLLSTFNNILFTRNIIYSGYMFRLAYLIKILKNSQIYESRSGQNWQLLLPFSYNFKIKVLDCIQYQYLVRANSHSHEVENNYKKIQERIEKQNEILINTFKNMNMYDDYKSILQNRYLHLCYNIAYSFKDKLSVKSYFKQLKQNKYLKLKDIIKRILINFY